LGVAIEEMRTKRITILLALVMLLTGLGNGQRRSYPFSSANSLPDKIEPSHFEFATANYSYSISNSGRGVRNGGVAPTRSFNLRLDRGDRLTHVVYYAEYRGDLLLICEATDDLYGAGFIVRVDGRTLKMKWKRALTGFNVGPGLVDGKYAYVTAMGFVGKVDLETGVYVWRHRDLYERSKHAFSIFVLPEVQGSLVIFKEAPDHLRKKVAIIKIERVSGRIVGFEAYLGRVRHAQRSAWSGLAV
jgi:hypothetical protein